MFVVHYKMPDGKANTIKCSEADPRSLCEALNELIMKNCKLMAFSSPDTTTISMNGSDSLLDEIAKGMDPREKALWNEFEEMVKEDVREGMELLRVHNEKYPEKNIL